MSKSKIIRQQIWAKLKDVAKPDTRFDMNFSEVIPDFEGSEIATDHIVGMPEYKEQEKPFFMSTYGIYRGFLLIEPGMVPKGAELYAAWLDGMEHFGRPISLEDIAKYGKIDFLVTGASAVSVDGVRFGKGHGFFELEWGMFTDLGLVGEDTPVVATVHDCQVVHEKLHPSDTDILVDHIATPGKLHTIERRAKRPHGVIWDLLEPEQIRQTPPLQELRAIQGLTPVT